MLLWNRILRTDSCIGVPVVLRPLMTLCRLCLIMLLGVTVQPSLGECPNKTGEELQVIAFSCFRNFSSHKQNLDKHDRKLYSGVDVETLRAFCSSYLAAMGCVGDLLTRCPEQQHADIKAALVTVQGSQSELNDLCRTNQLYETYAPFMTCFMSRGRKSEWCFDNNMNSSVSLLQELDSDEMCRRMREVVQCIENNIRQGCGQQAAELVHLLVRPTVKNSGSCNYDVYVASTEVSTRVTSSPNQKQGSKSPTGRADHRVANIPLLFICLHFIYLSYLLHKFSDS